MDNALHGFTKLVSSLLMFCAFTLTIVFAAYQIFSPEGHVFMWVEDLWKTSPALMIALGVVVLLAKRWLDGRHTSRGFANTMVYLTALVGIAAGISWLT